MTNESNSTEDSVTFDKLAGDFRAVVQDAENILKATAGELGDTLGAKTKEARERLSSSLENAKATCRQLEGKARAGVRATENVIRDHPVESVGVAFGVGIILGILLGRR